MINMKWIVLILICFWSYFLISYACSRINITKVKEGIARENGLSLLNLRHILGIIIFGIGGYLFSKTSGTFLLGDFLKDPAFSLSLAFFTTVSIDLSFLMQSPKISISLHLI